MRFTCSQAALSKAVNTVSKAVSAKTTMPVLKGILLQVKGSELYLTASNLDLSLESKIEVQDMEEGSVVVNARLFGEIIRRLPNAMVIAETDEQNSLNISCLGSEFSLVTLPSEDFPSIGTIENNEILTINKDAFRKLIDRTCFAASIDEKKGVLVGCLLKFKDNIMEMVALDGFRMAVAREEVSDSKERSVIIPARSLAEIARIMAESVEEEVICYIDEKKVQITTDNTRIIARLLEGEYIKYNDIIPKSYKTRVIVSREDLQSSIERASLLAKEGKNNLIKLTIANGSLAISSRSEEGNVNEVVDIESEGDDIVIGFNSKYITDSLKALSDEEICMEFTSPVSASLIKPVEGEAYTYLVLPVRISAY